MALKFINWFKGTGKRRRDAGRGGPHTTLIMEKLREVTAPEPGQLPVIGHLPVDTQTRITLRMLVVFVVMTAGAIFFNTMRVGSKADFVGAATQLQMLSQRIAKGAQQAAIGTPEAFEILKDSKSKFAVRLQNLREGGGGLPSAPGTAREELDQLARLWGPAERDIDAILTRERPLVAVSKSVAGLNKKNQGFLELTDQAVALIAQSGATVRTTSIAAQMAMLTQRIAKNGNALLAADVIDPEVANVLKKDVGAFRDSVNGLLLGSDRLRLAAVGDNDARNKLVELKELFEGVESDANTILGNMPHLVDAKRSAKALFVGSDSLLAASQALTRDFEALGGGSAWIAVITGLLAVASLVAFGLATVNEIKRRALAADQENKKNQEAILRLLDEMGELAEGNLTGNATVTEDITGAIADSINYTIDELRNLVTGINNATERVTQTTRQAQGLAQEVSQGARMQLSEIEEATDQVTRMSQSVTEVSGSAAESARVAHQSLAAAEKGAVAVQDSISGMNAIRDQIQETAKRIKRLGESSQEIGEIVELIADITEQTNVLALNAAIQAAAAGEAGRGFSVVAEEVQRLAEHSGEATRRIGAIVKTIQADTHDAVAAMETSTQGVVEGTRLSDAAGQALSEIGRVSRQLAALIETISAATRVQADTASKVANSMQDIRAITNKNTESTQRAADTVGELAGLAADLKGSVSGFKLS